MDKSLHAPQQRGNRTATTAPTETAHANDHQNGHASGAPAFNRTRPNRQKPEYSGKLIDARKAEHGTLRYIFRDGDRDKIRDAIKSSELAPENFQIPECRTIAETAWRRYYDSEPLSLAAISDELFDSDFGAYTYLVSAIKPKVDREPRWEDCLHTVKNWKHAAAAAIPIPTLTSQSGTKEYSPAQLVELIHPDWPVECLTSHAAHAQRIRECLGDVLCYSPNLGWLGYHQYWRRDDKHATRASARVATLSQAIREEAGILYQLASSLAKIGRESDARAMSAAADGLLRHTKQAESKAFIEGALHLAAGLLCVETEQFDQKPWVIGFKNGTWDNGVFREHRREDYLLYLSPVELDFNFDRSEWLAVLSRITKGDADFALMLQDVCGYILSAASHLRLLPFFYGPKGTGKSSVAELLQSVLGDMAATIDPKKLQSDAARERLGADLWNRRLAVCGEAGSQSLEAELLKTLSGGDRLAVRFLFREAFTAPPRHVLLMVTNDPPRMDAYDAALKDRVIALPFLHPLSEGEPLQLTGGARIEAVRQNAESPLVRGFVAWAVEGLARVHQSQNIYRASCSDTATAQLWADTDPLTPFWETIETTELQRGITKADLRGRYEKWCESEGARPFGRVQWARACDSHGLIDHKGTGGVRFWIARKVAQVAQQSIFEKGTREESKVPHEEFEKGVSCATCATNSDDEQEGAY